MKKKTKKNRLDEIENKLNILLNALGEKGNPAYKEYLEDQRSMQTSLDNKKYKINKDGTAIPKGEWKPGVIKKDIIEGNKKTLESDDGTTTYQTTMGGKTVTVKEQWIGKAPRGPNGEILRFI